MSKILNSVLRVNAGAPSTNPGSSKGRATKFQVASPVALASVLAYVELHKGVLVGVGTKRPNTSHRLDFVLKCPAKVRKPMPQWSHSPLMIELLNQFYSAVITYEEHRISVLALRPPQPSLSEAAMVGANDKVHISLWEDNLQGAYREERRSYHSHKEASDHSELVTMGGTYSIRVCTLDK